MTWWRVVHHLIAHPLLLLPGEWPVRFHDWTAAKAYPDE